MVRISQGRSQGRLEGRTNCAHMEAPMNTKNHRLQELSPSAKLVYKTLDYEGPQTQSALAESTQLPSRTTRYALNDLKEAELVTEEIYFPDARKRLYRQQ